MIDEFEKEYRFLSNFYWPIEVTFEGLVYTSTESAYQAAKSTDPEYRKKLQFAMPALAKKLGKKAVLRSDWEQIKLQVMESLLRQKFSIPELKEKLLATGDQELIEGNWWNDLFYGVCTGKRCRYAPHEPCGENNLGKLLMKIRNELWKK